MNIEKGLSIAVCTPIYPHSQSPESGAFVAKLVSELFDSGANVSIYQPVPYFKKYHSLRQVGVEVKHPRYISFSNLYRNRFLFSIYLYLYRLFVLNIYKWPKMPDLLYGKFLMTGGYLAYLLNKKYGTPYILDLGESKLLGGLRLGSETILAKKIIENAAGVVCVSLRLKNEIVKLGCKEDKILLLPNQVDCRRFFKMDKYKARLTVGLPMDKKIIAFTGHYIERKGPLRVKAALDILGDPYVGIFMGAGFQVPVGDNVLHTGSVPNEDLPYWLNAADIFVLPTLAEGSCNAVHEAMACGLPIVTSDIQDMDEFRGMAGVKFVDPLNIDDIVSAIVSVTGCNVNRFHNGEKSKNRGHSILVWYMNSFIH